MSSNVRSTDLYSVSSATDVSKDIASRTPLRFVTAASLFDGHDAAINIMRRLLQSSGAEVIHLGHNRGVAEIVNAAIQEDVAGIAISSYQGGHIEFFQYMIDMLNERNCGHIQVFGGGGGVIVPEEISFLHNYGVTRIYSPEDGQRMGLQGMIDDMLVRCREVECQRSSLDNEILDFKVDEKTADDKDFFQRDNYHQLALMLTKLENDSTGKVFGSLALTKDNSKDLPPVLGITGTGGSGKSSLTDELIRRFRLDHSDKLKIAILAVDPTRRKTGGALLGDRIRMNAINHPNIYFRSIATRDAGSEVPEQLESIVAATRQAGFDLVIVETPGIGQGDAGIVSLCDISMYVMTPEFGAATQLEKIDMLDFADVVVINKFDRRGSQDALRDVSKQVQRNREVFDREPSEMPVYGTISARFNDDGVTAVYFEISKQLTEKGYFKAVGKLINNETKYSTDCSVILPSERHRYLAEIASTIREYLNNADLQGEVVRSIQHLSKAQDMMQKASVSFNSEDLEGLLDRKKIELKEFSVELLEQWEETVKKYRADEWITHKDGEEIKNTLIHETLSGNSIRKLALPQYSDKGDLLRWLMRENLPGYFPFTAGVFPFRREGEDPTRMFAGEGDAFRTNRRFKALSEHSAAKRLSTAFDSVTLYGSDPHKRPDIYGKIGNSGVSIATVEDMDALYDGFDLCDPRTSVSMTINGPAPIILAFFFNTAFRQQQAKFIDKEGREPNEQELMDLRAWTLSHVRGTVQADILKEDQGQNTCLFSTDFSLKVMGDIQQYFVNKGVRYFYSVSISGYHIAEAGANPISQLAFTLANGFTYVEAYLARGMNIDDFAPNFSFFFSNGLDPEYTVMGRVARRIWAITMKERYGANLRSQKLKYHIQTSGRSLHAQEMAFNDIRTTLQALIAIYDNCNSLHTNAYDEAVTTPTEESVRRAMAIQLIINHEWGLAKNENPNQGAFIIDELTDLVEEAVLVEFERISERGGVLGAMETGYQRGKIQEDSLRYEHKKHDGSLPIIGVNTFTNEMEQEQIMDLSLSRSSDEEKQSQIARLEDFKIRNSEQSDLALERVRQAALTNNNVFEQLMDAVQYCTLGQITEALFEVGGQYRRNM